MNEPAIFVLIRDGERRYYLDSRAGAFLFREILWGPDALEEWVTQFDETGVWTDEVAAGVVVDFDNRTIVWAGDDEELDVLRVRRLYEQLLKSSWPNFTVSQALTGMRELAKAAGESDWDTYDEELESRYESFRSAAGLDWSEDDYDDYADSDADEDDADEDEEEQYDGDEADFDEDDEYGGFGDEPRAWVTIIEEGGAVRHRQLMSFSDDIINADPGILEELMALDAAEIPAESLVAEGIWFDHAKREIGFWGSRLAMYDLPRLTRAWHDWTVAWADGGYTEQCQAAGPAGTIMSDSQALGTILPIILSTKRFDIDGVLDDAGKQLKVMAIKAMGCLVAIIWLPILLFAVITQYWTGSLIAMGVVVVAAVIVFKVVEHRVKQPFQELDSPDRADDDRPPVAGPVDETARRQQLDEMLVAAGLPSFAEVELHFPMKERFDLFDDD